MRCAGQWWEKVRLHITPDTTAKWGPWRGTSHRVREVDPKTMSTSLASDAECAGRGQGPAHGLWQNILTLLWGLGEGRAEGLHLPLSSGVLGPFSLYSGPACLSRPVFLFLSSLPFFSFISLLFSSFFPSFHLSPSILKCVNLVSFSHYPPFLPYLLSLILYRQFLLFFKS